MSQQHSVNIPAHYNIYTGKTNRELRIDFSVPQNGVNKNTGLVYFSPGFGGNIDSKVYKKMRDLFADKYNLVTIQCDYFGSDFMQGIDDFIIEDKSVFNSTFTTEEIKLVNQNPSIFLNVLSQKNVVLPVKAKLSENIDNFNDMSYMQAIDIITAIEAVKIILIDNQLELNKYRIIGYGHSHGAYLLHLANTLVPDLFSFIIDNSAWLEPVYLSSNRYLYQKVGMATLAIEFDYIAKNIIKDKNALNLKSLYKNSDVKTQVLTFQGDDDNLVSHLEKQKLIEGISNSTFILVTENDIDLNKFKSNKHGLNADFLELFSYALKYEISKMGININKEIYTINLSSVDIKVNYTKGLPIFDIDFK